MLGLGLGLNRFNLAALPAAIQRYFSTFDPVLNTYGELDTAFTPSGDFEVEAQFSTVSASIVSIFSGTNQNDDGIGLRMNANGSLFAFVFVGAELQTTITSSAGFNDGDLHTVQLVYTGTTAELFIDGVSEGSATWSLDGNQHIKNIGYRPVSLQYYDGIIANVKLTDLATPANSRIFPVGLSGGASVENSTINSGSITYYNLPAANQYGFTFANNRWVADDNLWGAGDVTFDGTEPIYTIIVQASSILTVGYSYIAGCTADISQGIGYIENFDGSTYDVTAFSNQVFTATNPSPRVQTKGIVPTVGTVIGLEFKRLLEIA